jgi:transcriptional regulator with XRE-family HTH domain
MVRIGEKLRQRARALGFSDAEVARRLDLSPSRYGHYVKDTREPDFLTLERICRVLDTTPNYLFGFEGLPKAATEEGALRREIFETLLSMEKGDLCTARRVVQALAQTRDGAASGQAAEKRTQSEMRRREKPKGEEAEN